MALFQPCQRLHLKGRTDKLYFPSHGNSDKVFRLVRLEAQSPSPKNLVTLEDIKLHTHPQFPSHRRWRMLDEDHMQ